ncbi:MAG: hypothetical protein AAGA11_17660 [Pseudomonadota bacterium]
MRVAWIVVCFAMVGCNDERTDSTFIANDGVYPSLVVEDDGSRTRLRFDLDVGGPSGTNLTLANGETLQVGTGG